MDTFGPVVLFCLLLINKTTADVSKTNTDRRKIYQPTKLYSNNGFIGVASVATSRNGKMSGLQVVMTPEESKDKSKTMTEQKFQLIDAPFGNVAMVASSAEIIPRNGRISSLRGVKIYPTPMGATAAKEDLANIFKINKIVDSGAIHMLSDPEMSASATVGYMPKSNTWSSINVPFAYDGFLQPTPIGESPMNLEPLFVKFFRELTPVRPVLSSGFRYPNFDPFMNYWR